MSWREIKTAQILNMDHDESTINIQTLFESDGFNSSSYIISDVDEEILILIEFKNHCVLQSIKLHALFDMECEEDISAPKSVNIYVIDNVSKDFSDINALKPDKTVALSKKKLSKGQTINLQKATQSALKFKNVKYLAIYIESNQNDSEKTYMNGISFKTKGQQTKTNVDTTFTDDDFMSAMMNLHMNNDTEFKNASSVVHSYCSGSINHCTYFDRLKININAEDTEHTPILDDHLHLLLYHNDEDQMHCIYDALSGHCDIKQCVMFKRNHNIEQNQSIAVQIHDKIHCFYFHAFDIGHRVRRNETLNDAEDDCKHAEEHNTLFNPECKRLYEFLSTKHQLYRDFGGIQRVSKFKDLTMYNDEMYQKSNNEEMKEKVYSFGFDYRYKGWEDEYRSVYFIESKYKSLKDELLHNPLAIVNIEQYDNEYKKAQLHFNTPYAKSLISRLDPVHKIRYENGKVTLDINRLLVVLFYCNYDTLQFEFTKTYRKDVPNESRESIIKRHRHFYWFGMYLKQCVHWFGKRISQGTIKRLYHGVNQNMLLPFGGAIDIFSDWHYASVRIMGPLSTTSSFPVAIHFAGDKGLILEIKDMSINEYKGLMHTMTTTKYFECDWLSDFGNEKEYLFLQNKEVFIVSNIIEATSGTEYRLILEAINYLECNNLKKTDDPQLQVLHSIEVIMIAIVEDALSDGVPTKYKKLENMSKYARILIKQYREHKTICTLDWYRNENYDRLKKKLELNNWIDVGLLNIFYLKLEQLTFNAEFKADDIVENILFYLKNGNYNGYGLKTIDKITIFNFGDNVDDKYRSELKELGVDIEFEQHKLCLRLK